MNLVGKMSTKMTSFRPNTYLDGHHDDKAVLYNLVVSDGLLIIFHDFAVSNKLLGFSRLTMRLCNQGFQSADLKDQSNYIHSIHNRVIMMKLKLTFISGWTSRGNCYPFNVLRVIFIMIFLFG